MAKQNGNGGFHNHPMNGKNGQYNGNQRFTNDDSKAKERFQRRLDDQVKAVERELNKGFRPGRSPREYASMGIRGLGGAAALGQFIAVGLYTQSNSFYETLIKLDNAVDSLSNLVGMGKTARRQRNILNNTKEGVETDKEINVTLFDLLQIAQNGADKTYKNNPAKFKAASEALAQFRQLTTEQKKRAQEIQQMSKSYEKQIRDTEEKVADAFEDLETIFRSGHDALRNTYNALPGGKEVQDNLDKAMETLQNLGRGLLGKEKIKINDQAREQRTEYLQKMREYRDQIKKMEQIAEGLSKEYKEAAAAAKPIAESARKAVSALESNIAVLEAQAASERQMEVHYQKIEGEMAKAERTLIGLAGPAEDIHEAYQVLLKAHEAKKRARQEGRIAYGNTQKGKNIGERVEAITQKSEAEMSATIAKRPDLLYQEKILGLENPAYISAGIMAASALVGILVYLAAAHVAEKVKGNAGAYRQGIREGMQKAVEAFKGLYGNLAEQAKKEDKGDEN